MTDIPELTDEQLESAIPAGLRRRLIRGHIESEEDVAALRGFVGLTQIEFARAIGISVHTLGNGEHPAGGRLERAVDWEGAQRGSGGTTERRS